MATLALGLAVVLVPLEQGTSQAPPPSQDLPVTRAVASRAEIERSIAEIEEVLASPGYSGRLKGIKRVEAQLLRERLQNGDFQPGDRVFISVLGEVAATDTFSVTPSRTLLMPGVAEFPLAGVLRSELQSYMTEQLTRFFRRPTVGTKAYIRLTILGGVRSPGFYYLPAEQLLGTAIMSAGGPAGNARIEDSEVMRDGKKVRSKDAVTDALSRGLTLDQFNLQAGDQFVVGAQASGNVFQRFREVGFGIGALASLVFLVARVVP